MRAQSDAQKIINSVKSVLRQTLRNGAYTQHTYGVVSAVTGNMANVFIAGDPVASEDFRIPSYLGTVTVGAKVRVTITPDAHKWIDEVLP